jgi:hypothetical protein
VVSHLVSRDADLSLPKGEDCDEYGAAYSVHRRADAPIGECICGGDAAPPHQVIALGRDLAIVYLSGEVFVDLGLAIKEASPFRTMLVVELCNCVETVYIPTRVAYAVCSYEVTNSTVKPGAGELLAETAVRLLRDAASGTPSAPLSP